MSGTLVNSGCYPPHPPHLTPSYPTTTQPQQQNHAHRNPGHGSHSVKATRRIKRDKSTEKTGPKHGQPKQDITNKARESVLYLKVIKSNH